MDEVLEGPAQAVEPRHDHRVSGAELVQEPIKLWPPVERPRRLVGEDLHARSSLEGVVLLVGVLLLC